jgi:hypothetical protein
MDRVKGAPYVSVATACSALEADPEDTMDTADRVIWKGPEVDTTVRRASGVTSVIQ